MSQFMTQEAFEQEAKSAFKRRLLESVCAESEFVRLAAALFDNEMRKAISKDVDEMIEGRKRDDL